MFCVQVCVYIFCSEWINWYCDIDSNICSWHCTLQAFWKFSAKSSDNWQKKNDKLKQEKDNGKERLLRKFGKLAYKYIRDLIFIEFLTYKIKEKLQYIINIHLSII